ncbi:MAG TPA: GtrA family protein [Patescibacteria group bacterium]|nr:GtrA family protein [Patescibacteria group bacterium]
MLNKLIVYYHSTKKQFFRYFVVGVTGVFLDLGLLMVFKEYLHWTPVMAVALSQILVILYNFLLNKYWSFGNKEMPHRQFVRFMAIVAFNYALSVVVIYIFSQKIGFDYRLVRLANIILSVSWNFLLYKYWVYKVDKVLGSELPIEQK